jgi:hypothetical protein
MAGENWYCANCARRSEYGLSGGTVGAKSHFRNGCPRCGSDDVYQDEPIKCDSCGKAFDNETFFGLQITDRCPNCDREELQKKLPRKVTWPPDPVL